MVMKLYVNISLLAGSVWHGAIVSALSDVITLVKCDSLHTNNTYQYFHTRIH